MKKKEVQTDKDVEMIQCNFCNNWHHSSCANFTIDQVRQYSKPGIMWQCEFKGFSAYIDDLFKSDSDKIIVQHVISLKSLMETY